MRPRGRTLALVAALLVPGPVGAGSLLLEMPFGSLVATPLWFSPLDTEADTYRVRVAAPGGFKVDAVAKSGHVQLHRFPYATDRQGEPMWAPHHAAYMDLVPATRKTLTLPPGDWTVAVDPATPVSLGTVRFEGDPAKDSVEPLGRWSCPTYVRRGCLP